MAQKKFLSWVGFKGEDSVDSSSVEQTLSSTTTQAQGLSNVARIRELENQLAELRSRRDLTSLTKEEFEILASETAMTLIKTAQSRESKALAASQKLINDSNRAARELFESTESKAKNLLVQAESRGRKYIEAAESDASALLEEATQEAEKLIAAKRREAAAVTSAAKREAEELVSGAVTDISDYRSWLTSAISEAERLHRIQTQSLNAAEQAIEQTRNRLTAAFEKLSALQVDLDANLESDNRPKTKNFVRETEQKSPSANLDPAQTKAKTTKKNSKKAPATNARVKAGKKSAAKTATKSTKKAPAKKASAKRR